MNKDVKQVLIIIIIVILICLLLWFLIIGLIKSADKNISRRNTRCSDKCQQLELTYYEYVQGGFGACAKCICLDSNNDFKDIYAIDGGQCLR